MRKTRLSISKAVQAIALVAVLVVTGGSAQAEWTAYNDCVFDSTVPTDLDPNGQTVHYTGSNVTTFGVGNVTADYGGTAETANQPYTNNSGALVNQSDGSATGATLTVSQNGADPAIWQPQVAATWTGGYDTAVGTDARNTFGGIADMTGVSFYGATSAWFVDYTITGLDPNEKYTFVCSSSRAQANTTGGAGYTTRMTDYTISDAVAFTNASTAGTTVSGAGAVTTFVTGNNHTLGYVTRWTDIEPGTDGDFTVRATPNPATDGGLGRKAYSCDVLLVQEQAADVLPPFTPTVPSLSGWGYGALLVVVFGIGAFTLRRYKV